MAQAVNTEGFSLAPCLPALPPLLSRLLPLPLPSPLACLLRSAEFMLIDRAQLPSARAVLPQLSCKPSSTLWQLLSSLRCRYVLQPKGGR